MQQLSYAALGDSTGVGVGARHGGGYVARLYERLARERPVHLSNTCVSGATSTDLVRWQLPRALGTTPHIATVFIGINDLIRGLSAESYRQNIELVATGLSAKRVRTLFCTIPDLSYAPAAVYFMAALRVPRPVFEQRTLAFNAALMDVAKKHGHGAHDLYTVALADKAHFFSSDGFHPSDAGYEALAQELWPSFRALAESR
jgi:lysophospholipase L1-like esterase